jgi:hypothetical protein
MPSRDWDDSWYDDDEFPPMRQKRERGGIVTVAVLSFIMCGFNGLSALCLLPCGVLMSFLGPGNNAPPLPGNLLQHGPLLMLGFGIMSGLAFVMQIVAGIGLLNSRRWARTMSFYLAGYSLLTAGILAYLTVAALASDVVNPDESMAQAMLGIIGLVFHGGYALVVFLVLLNRRAVASLR